jgi:putative flavoprotein involved in K+ transport
MEGMPTSERVDTVVIGAGQSGLSVGYHLKHFGVPFVILESSPRVGDSWRRRWDSLRLFTPAKYDGLVGMPFPAPPHSFPTKDEMGDYLASYADRFELPVRTGAHVDRVAKAGDRYVVSAGGQTIEAANVVIAMASYQTPRIPPFAAELSPDIRQLHSSEYRNPDQLRSGGVLVVGAGNSGAEIAVETARHAHPTWLSGRDTGHLPFSIDGRVARMLVPVIFRVVFHHLLTVDTPMGRKARPNMMKHSGPLIRQKPRDIAAAGVQRVARMAGVRDDKPVLDDGTVLPVENVIWCTGFNAGMSWLDLPVLDADGEPTHERGVVAAHPGLYFVGLHFLYSLSSTMIHGVARDAERIARSIVARRGRRASDSAPAMRQPSGGGARSSSAARASLST